MHILNMNRKKLEEQNNRTMKKDNLYLILHINSKNSYSFNTFKENIANNYLSKVISETSIIISSKTDKSAEEVFKKLGENISEKEQIDLEIFVIEMTNFYGSLPDSTWKWIESKTDAILLK